MLVILAPALKSIGQCFCALKVSVNPCQLNGKWRAQMRLRDWRQKGGFGAVANNLSCQHTTDQVEPV
jgi:hypothetical protein